MPTISPWKRVRYRLEDGLFGAFGAACRVLPPRWLVGLGGSLGRLGYLIDRNRRNIALSNLELAFGDDLDEHARRRITRGVYQHLGKFVFEYLLLLVRDYRPYNDLIEIDNLEGTRAALAEHGKVVFVTAHVGHWELMGAAASEVLTPFHSVMKPLSNPYLNARVMRLRQRLGMPLLKQRDAVRGLMRLLRDGHPVALLTDQNQKRRPLFVDFFGVPAATVATAAVLAIRFRVPMITGFCWRSGKALEYRGRFDEPLLPDPSAPFEEEVRRLTAAMNHHIEAFVREHPDQWNWIHPRWRTRPPAEIAGSSEENIP